jgi:GT2 family glycosyltransferase
VPIDLSVIIVNWNSAEHLRKCLSSIAADQNSPDLEVLVVDNASYDGSAEMVRRQFPWVRFIQSAENLGFAGGNNLARQHAQGDTLLFLNPDTEVFPSALKRMLVRLWASPGVGAVGPRLLNSDLSLQTTCLQAFPTFWNLLFDADALKVMFPRWRIWGMRPLFSNGTDADVAGMISGACLMVRRDAFDHVEGFSPEYFIYGEDLDLCYKLKNAGWTLKYVDSAEVVHHGGQSTKSRSESGFGDVLIRQAVYNFVRKTRGAFYAKLCRMAICISAIIRISILTLLRVAPTNISRSKALQHRARKWVQIFRWSVGSLPWTDEYNPASVTAPEPRSRESITR